jgi:hypothetical protein
MRVSSWSQENIGRYQVEPEDLPDDDPRAANPSPPSEPVVPTNPQGQQAGQAPNDPYPPAVPLWLLLQPGMDPENGFAGEPAPLPAPAPPPAPSPDSPPPPQAFVGPIAPPAAANVAPPVAAASAVPAGRFAGEFDLDVDADPRPQTATAAASSASASSAPVVTADAASAPPSAAPAVAFEPPVSADWLRTRETALTSLRSDYETARAQAQNSRPTSGLMATGWVPAESTTDGAVYVIDPNAPPVVASWDEGGPQYQAGAAGQWFAFDEAAFANSYRDALVAKPSAALQSLAAAYNSNASELFTQKPDLWALATAAHALNAGPAPAGMAMGAAKVLAYTDLYLADPQIAALIQNFGGEAGPATSPVALEQSRLYGEARFQQLTRLSNAMQSVRDQYVGAMADAQRNGGPGWVERPIDPSTVALSDEGAAQSLALFERVFDPDVFTANYIKQPGLANQAFAEFYGQSHTTVTTDEVSSHNGSETFSGFSLSFANPDWSLNTRGGKFAAGTGMAHSQLEILSPNDTDNLRDDNAVGFELEIGWVTGKGNIDHGSGWEDKVAMVVIVAVVAYVSAFTMTELGYGAAAGMTGAMASGAVVGATTSIASGLLNNNLTLKNVLRGALGGALTGGLLEQYSSLLKPLGDVGTVALRTTVQGSVQALLGGSFKEGAIAGFASGLATVVSNNILDGIKTQGSEMSPADIAAARTLARVVGSAIRAVASPDDQLSAFGSSLLGDLLNDMGPKTPITVFDDDGNLMPGVVNTSLPMEQQIAALQRQLQEQGLSVQEAGMLAIDALWQAPPQALFPPTTASQNWTAQELQTRVDAVEQALQDDIRAQQARDDSLLTPDDLREDTGGAGTARGTVQPILNRGFDAALNAAADVTGLMAPIQALQADLDHLQAKQAESRINDMRQAMRNAGMTNVADNFEKVWTSDGRAVPDYKATAEKLSQAYEGFVRDQRLRANWGDNYQSVRIGRSQMTVQEFETRTLGVQQQAANVAYDRGKVLIATGQLTLKNGDFALTLGTYIDGQVRLDLREFGRAEGLTDSRASNLFAVNRYIQNKDMVGIPDLRLGLGLLSDVSLSPKNGLTDQLRRWNAIVPNDTIIIRPAQMGGSYVVPRATIQPVLPIRGRP